VTRLLAVAAAQAQAASAWAVRSRPTAISPSTAGPQ
jgi:hypothetical protein